METAYATNFLPKSVSERHRLPRALVLANQQTNLRASREMHVRVCVFPRPRIELVAFLVTLPVVLTAELAGCVHDFALPKLVAIPLQASTNLVDISLLHLLGVCYDVTNRGLPRLGVYGMVTYLRAPDVSSP